jgi:hypothetical protein
MKERRIKMAEMTREEWVTVSLELSDMMAEMNNVLKKHNIEHLSVCLSTAKDGCPMILGGKYDTSFHGSEIVFRERNEPYRRMIRA